MDIDRRLDEIILEKLKKNPDAKCIWWDGKWYLNQEIFDLIDATTVTLKNAGFSEGQRLSVLMPNCPMIIALMVACWRLGGAINPLNVKSGVPSLVGTLKLVDPFAVVVSDEIRKEAGPVLSSEGYVTIVSDLAGPLPDFEGRAVSVEDRSLAVVFATSGTTGLPKAVPLSHGNLIANVEAVNEALEDLEKGDIFLNVLPNFHSFGYTVCTLLPIFIEGAQTIVPGFLPPMRTLNAIVDSKANVLPLVPAMLTHLLAAIERGGPRPEKLKIVLTGGDRYNVELDEKLKRLMGLGNLQGYGVTETSPVISVNRNYNVNKLGTVGPFLKNIEWQLRPDGDNKPIDGEGVLWVRGPSVTDRYFRDEAMSAERFDADGWFNTGDYVRVDKDGYLSILDRVTDIIIVGGFNVYPQEVERILNAHPAVESAIVVGMPHPTNGEVPKAFILKKEGAKITDIEIVKYSKEHLAHYKVPRKVEFVNDWPLSGTGKIMRRVLKEREK
ncbi:MAG: AMP-binding protein [Synergistaceae bacterium]|nr:AMP-binding protein [Synergistaceae bacterium]